MPATSDFGMFQICELIEKKRDGRELNKQEIEYLVQAIVRGHEDTFKDGVLKAQTGALLMAIYMNGMTDLETSILTRTMAESGHILQWPKEYKDLIVDKHSTGGVGDKVSHVLTPALAACGLKVPMISGRSLGFTGGTLDKLESIPDFKVSASKQDIAKYVDAVGCCIVGQTEEMVPADKILYNFRNLTGTVNSLPLITASIVSKKIAEGLSALVFDIKCGRGALMKTEKEALQLAVKLTDVAEKNGIKASGFITNMDAPLGKMIGNSLEIVEAIETLQGKGPQDLKELVAEMGGELLTLTGKSANRQEGSERIKESLTNGKALEKFCEMLSAQGVRPVFAGRLCSPKNNPRIMLPAAKYVTKYEHKGKTGIVQSINAEALAKVWKEEMDKSGNINYGVGLELVCHIGDELKTGDIWIHVHHEDEHLSRSQINLLESAVKISKEKWNAESRIYREVKPLH